MKFWIYWGSALIIIVNHALYESVKSYLRVSIKKELQLVVVGGQDGPHTRVIFSKSERSSLCSVIQFPERMGRETMRQHNSFTPFATEFAFANGPRDYNF